MTEAEEKLRRVESNLRVAEILSEEYEKAIKEIKEDIAKLEESINKPERWQDKLVQPKDSSYYFITSFLDEGLIVTYRERGKDVMGMDRKPEYAFATEDQAQLLADKMNLMQEMHAFAHVKNEGWLPDWGDENPNKWGISIIQNECKVGYCHLLNSFIFGIAVKSKEIAEEMLEEFGERIEGIYNKQY